MAESNSSVFVQPAIPKFDGHYDHWAMLMENFLRSKEYWDLIENGISGVVTQGVEDQAEAQHQVIEGQKLKDLKAKNYLFQAIDRNILETILDKDTSKGIWDSMKQKYQGSTKVKRAQLQALRRDFEILHMKDGETVNNFFARTLTIANKMKAHGETMSQTIINEKVLRSMTSKFDYVVCSIEESNDLNTMTIDELQSSLLVHEQRMHGHRGEEQVLKVTHEDNSSKGRGRGVFKGRGRGRGKQPFNKTTIECFKCHRLGHFQYECPSEENGANYAELDEGEELLLMSYVELNHAQREAVWFLDSGCSNHMSGNKEWFSDLDVQFRQTVKLGNNSRMAVMGKGNIRMQVNGFTQVISEVYYIPELKNNLLSMGQLQEKGVAILIQQGKCKVFHPSKGLIIQSEMSANRMFVVLAAMMPKATTCFQAVTEDESYLWHCRFGHLGFKGLRTLQYKKMVSGLPSLLKTPAKLCTTCLVGKQHRESIPKRSLWRASQKLELVHADICGPITPASNSNKRYFLSFIDDFSRKTWIYFLHEKSEAFTMFRSYKAYVEKEAGAYLKCLRTDRGGEFTSNEFGEFCKANGITRQLTTAYTPQQNGVAERKNRTVMNLVRCMLTEKQVPKVFWPEAVRWCVHVLNRCPTLAMQNRTPEEAWSGTKPTVEYFRVFGCLAHVHVPDQKRIKLDDKSVRCVLLGVSDESKAYRLFDPVSKKIIVSRDVVFEENEGWNWNMSSEEMVSDVLEWGDSEEERDATENEEEFGAEANENEEAGSNSTNGVGSSSTSSPSSESHDENSPGSVQGRARQVPRWMQDYETGEGLSEEEDLSAMAVLTEVDPITFEEAVKSKKWRDAMNAEIEAIERNKTWDLTILPEGVKTIGVKWVFKTKLNENGEIDKYKARIVAKGYAQQYGIDYTEVYAPVARLDTIRLVIALAAQEGWNIFQLDVKSAFLHGELSEEVYVQQPQGYEQKGEEHKVYKLNKALYGLKQAPRAWYSKIEGYFAKEGFEKCHYEHTLFTKSKEGGKLLIVSLYVDDLIFTGNDKSMCEEFKKSMMLEFDMSDLGKMRYFLGIEVLQHSDGIYVCQRKYAHEVLERFGMDKSNLVKNPIVPGCRLSKDENGAKVDASLFKQVVGSLMYLTATRPDLMYGVSLISRFMSCPTEQHWSAAKRLLRYLKGTTDLGIFYKKGDCKQLTAYSDSDFAGDLDDRKSTTGCVFMFNSGAVSWSSKKQPVVSLSTTEAEYIAAASCACQCVWLRRVLTELGYVQEECTTILCDNSSTIKLSKNPVLHGRSKHIDIRFHFLRELVRDGVVDLRHCNTQDQIADIMTKPLRLEVFLKLRSLLGVCEVPNIN